METLVKGDVIVLDFPYSDFSEFKRRPAVVVAELPGSDVIVCQVSSRMRGDENCVSLDDGDFVEGSLKTSSFVRAGFISTVDRSLILYRAGRLRERKICEIKEKLIEILTK
jgi:mRNA interferase MazF